MVARGRIHNGVVVLEEGAHFSEGQEVTVLGLPPAPTGVSLSASSPHSVLDIPVVSLGSFLRTPTADDDLLGEMLDGRS